MDTTNDAKNIHVLLVDDDALLQADAKDFLEPYGCKISPLRDGSKIEEAIAKLRPDIVLLDVMLPGADGFTVLKRLRAASRIPVIMLTARGNDTDRIVGLEMGADDYLAKPFNPRELLARIRAVLRRSSSEGPDSPAYTEQPNQAIQPASLADDIAQGSLYLDGKMQRLRSPEAAVDLTITEYRLMRVFMQHPNLVLTREDLQSKAFGGGNDRNIDVYVSRLRGTLRKVHLDSLIRTIWGSGYCWVMPEEGKNLPGDLPEDS